MFLNSQVLEAGILSTPWIVVSCEEDDRGERKQWTPRNGNTDWKKCTSLSFCISVENLVITREVEKKKVS